ncbi:MAG: FecR domain-containing protein [Reyranella sp.]|nr:FecR domain-containing protein [Reyranella sp.]
MVKANVIGFPLVRAMLLGTTAIALFGAPFGIPEAAARVGVTSATDGDPLGKPPAEAERVLRIGIDVQANEVITTNARDRAHLVFLDGTSLTVGPSAQLTIDKFVYDPATKTGDLAINASKGVFRLVGGKISKTKPITITTPSGTIGIRGGITIFTVQPTSTTSTFVFGNGMTFSAAGQTQTVTRPGSQVTASGGAAPSAPVMVGQGGLTTQLSQLEGTSQSSGQSGGGGGGGGTTSGNADQKAQSSGFSSRNSGQAPGAVQPGANIGPTPAAQRINNSELVATALSNNQTVEQTAQAQAQASQKQTTTTTSTTQVIVTRGRFFGDTPYTAFNNQTLGVTPNSQKNVLLNSTGTVSDGKATITLSDGRSVTVPWNPGSGSFSVSLNHPTFGMLTGKGFVSSNSDYFAYVFDTTNNERIGVIGGTPTKLAQFPTTGFATHTVIDLGNSAKIPFANETVGNDTALKAAANKSPLYSAYSTNIAPTVGGAEPGAARATAMQATVSISGQGTSQKSYMGAFIGTYFKDYNNSTISNAGRFNASYRLGDTQQIGRQVSAESTFDTGAGNSIFGSNGERMVFTPDALNTTVTSSSSIVSTITTTRTSQASFDQPYNNLNGSDYFNVTQATRTSATSTTENARTSQTMNGYVGGIVEKRDSSGNFTTRVLGNPNNAAPSNVILITDAASNRASATFTVPEWDGSTTSATFRLGGTSGANFSTSSFIDNKIYAVADRPSDVLTNTTSVTFNSTTSSGADVQSRTVAVSYGTAPFNAFFQAAGVTPCACEFLTWGVWGGDVRYGAASVYNADGRDRLNFASYVAGTLTSAVSLPMTGTATYSGHAFGNVQNGTSAYLAAGSYTNAWNFASQTGAVTIGNFDGATYTGTTALTNGTVNFTGTLSGASRTGAVAGSFFDAPGAGGVAKGQAGTFTVTGTGYKAGGTFMGQKP